MFLIIGLMGLFLPGFVLANGLSAGQEERRLERDLRRKGLVEILIVQSLDHPVSKQIQQGFQERLAEEKGLRFSSLSKEGLQFRFVTYDVKGKFANSRVLAQLLSRKDADLVLAIGASAAQTAILASKLKTQITTDRGESEGAVEALPRSENPAADTQTSVTQTAFLSSTLESQIMAKDGSEAVAIPARFESEAATTQADVAHTVLLAFKLKATIRLQGENEGVEASARPAREAVNTQSGPEGEKADTQPVPAAPSPIVFTAVMNPFYLHILPKNEPNGPLEHVYGVLDPPPIQNQLRLMRLVMPRLERLGVVYSEDVVTVVKLVEDLKEMAPVFGIEVLAVPIHSLEGVASAYTALAPEVEAFFMPLDDRLLVQVDLILALANHYFLPVFGSDSASVERGALAGLGYNYHEAGRMAAELALRALKAPVPAGGTSLADMPQLVQQKQRLTLNQKTARRLRIVFPASALREADSILD